MTRDLARLPGWAGRTTVFLLALASVTTTRLPAQDTTQVRDSAVVHTLPSLTVAAVRQRVIAPPVATIRVDSARLRRTQAFNAWDLVRRTAGVEVHEQGQGPGFASDAVIRGFTSDHSSDVLLQVDGVPINLPLHGHVEGYADWNILFPGAARSLRVIHGPASALSGNFAYGGVVEVETPWGADQSSGSVGASTFGDASAWLLTGSLQNDEQRGWMVGGRFERSDGWRDHSHYVLGNAIARGKTRLGGGSLEGGALLYASDWDSPGFVSVADFLADRVTQAGDPTDGGNAERGVVHGRYTGLLGQHAGLSILGWGQALRSHMYLNIPEGDEAPAQTDELDQRWSTGVEATLDGHTTAGDLTLGVSGRFDDVRYRLFDTEARVFEDSVSAYDGTFGTGAIYGRWRRLVGSFLLDLGLRVDALHFRSNDLVQGTGPRSETDVVIGPKLGTRWIVNGHVAVLGSVSRGFRSPPGVIADPTLPVQTAWAKELALEYLTGSSQWRLALFRLDVAHERIQDPIARAISEAGSSVRQGVEVEVDASLTDRIHINASGTFNDATVSDLPPSALALDRAGEPGLSGPRPVFHLEPLEPGDPVPGVSRYLARTGLQFLLSNRISVGSLFRLNGPFTPIGEPTIRTGTYGLVDLSGTVYRILGRWALDWELQNLFDAAYPEVRSSGYLNPGAPRAFRVALRF